MIKKLWKTFNFNQKLSVTIELTGFTLMILTINQKEFSIGTFVLGVGIGMFASNINKNN